MRATTLIVCTLVAALAGCASSSVTQSDGTILTTPPPSGTTYTSRLGNFTCKVPVLVRPGAHQMERADADAAEVGFNDDFGTLLRIESERIPSELAPNLTPQTAPHTLDDFFDKSVFEQGFRSVSPQAAVLHREHVQTAAGPALFAVVFIPGGSNLAETDESGHSHHLDSTRGVFIFTQHGFIYVITNQEWPAGGNIGHSPLKDRIARLLTDVQQTVSGMTFR